MSKSWMTPQGFTSWLLRMGGGKRRLSDHRAAEALGISRNTVRAYREGNSPMPKHIALACAAISLGIPPAQS